ncbi:hypothetical protein PINS_up007899 [Pythium insidiosum]|nr:hypothetical protein PINS_up007899 [Pythium insidiosum]
MPTASAARIESQAQPPAQANQPQFAFPKPFVMHQVDVLRAINVRKVACGALHSLALSADGKLFAWGCNDGGRLGLGVPRHGPTERVCKPTQVCGRLDALVVLDIACGAWHNACIASAEPQTTSGRVFTWGTGIYGQVRSHDGRMNRWIGWTHD